MRSLLNRLHTRIGDLWWYSVMIFIACRSGDAIQAFIGLWLVPKYVGPQELGAVMPLQQLSSFFTVPLAVVAVVFSKYVNTYATRGEHGKIKSFIHDVILVSSILFLASIAAAYWLIPHFYTRLNIAAGSLTALVLVSGFVCNISGLFGSALQGLKKFTTITVQNLISAPIRLITLLVTMPIRPLSGYLLGQTTPSASCGLLAALTIHNDLKHESPDTSWRKDLPDIWKLLWPYAVCTIIGTAASTLMATVYRQRLPEVESAAHYLLMRFADTVGFVGSTLGVVLLPLASEAHEQGHENRKLIWSSIIGIGVGCVALALVFSIVTKPLFASVDAWSPYREFAHLLPCLTLAIGPGLIAGTVANYDFFCNRIGTTVLLCLLNAAYAVFLVSFTGCEFFRGLFSDPIVNWMSSLHINNLSTLTTIHLCVNTFIALAILAASTIATHRRK